MVGFGMSVDVLVNAGVYVACVAVVDIGDRGLGWSPRANVGGR